MRKKPQIFRNDVPDTGPIQLVEIEPPVTENVRCSTGDYHKNKSARSKYRLGID
jgi:hypothetical protein